MSNPSCAAPQDVWSEVRANDQVIRYRRCGAGPNVLVLRADHHDDEAGRALLDALAAQFRLLIPELPATGAELGERLALFLDGLGVADVAVLAYGNLCLPALELALLGGEQVARLALVADGPGDAADLDGALVTAPGQAPLPLVLLREGGRGAGDLSTLVRFLGDAVPARRLAGP
jgi:hypothetical protein